MRELDFYYIVAQYFQFYVFNVAALMIMIYCLPLKVSRRKAILLVLLYAQFQPIADSLTAFLVGGRNVEFNIYWYILLKIIIIIEMSLPILLSQQAIRLKWYMCYWVYVASVALLSPTTSIYFNYFAKTDVVEAYTYRPVTWANLWVYLLGLIMEILVAVIVAFIIKRLVTARRLENVNRIVWAIINLIIFSLIGLGEKNYFVEDNAIKGISNFNFIFIFIMIAFSGVLLAIFVSEQKLLTVENQLLKKQNELQYESLQNKQEFDQELHMLYHDIGNHIQTIRLLLEAGEKQKACDYTDDLLHKYRSLSKKNYCSNKIINAVLSQKMILCEEKNITTELEINLPQELPIQDIDLMCVLSNLLDNAIEGCSRQQTAHPYLKLQAFIKNQYCSFYLVNSKPPQHKGTEEERRTWKKDKTLHGYGMKIITRIVERYEGQQEINETEDEFQVLVMLKILTPH